MKVLNTKKEKRSLEGLEMSTALRININEIFYSFNSFYLKL